MSGVESQHEHRARNGRRRTLNKIGKATAYALGFSPMAAFGGLTTASAQDYFGPHQATYEVVIDDATTLDFGAIGKLRLPEHFGPFGVEATVHGIQGTNNIDQTQFISDAARKYEQQYRFRSEFASQISDELLSDARNKAIYYELGFLALAGIGAAGLNEKAKRLSSPLMTAGVSISLVAGGLTIGTESTHAASTPLQIEGLPGATTDSEVLRFGVNRVVPSITNLISREEHNGDLYVEKIREQLPQYKSLMTYREDDETVIFAYSDLHCSLSQSRLLKTLADIYNPDAALNAGDTVSNGLTVEKPCVDNAAKIERVTYVVKGNHGSSTTIKQEKDAGMHVLQGDSERIEGTELTVLGDSDPERTPAFASGAATRYSKTGKTEEDLGAELRKKASKDKANIVIMHQPAAADEFFNGDVPDTVDLVLSGHTHELKQPVVHWYGNHPVIDHRLGTAGGLGPQTLGSLNTPFTTPTKNSTVEAYRINNKTKRIMYQTITMTPKAELIVSPWLATVSESEIEAHSLPYTALTSVDAAPRRR